jgi:hypothetical protein
MFACAADIVILSRRLQVADKVCGTMEAVRPFSNSDIIFDFGCGPGITLESIFYSRVTTDPARKLTVPAVGSGAYLVDVSARMVAKSVSLATLRCPMKGVMCKAIKAFEDDAPEADNGVTLDGVKVDVPDADVTVARPDRSGTSISATSSGTCSFPDDPTSSSAHRLQQISVSSDPLGVISPGPPKSKPSAVAASPVGSASTLGPNFTPEFLSWMTLPPRIDVAYSSLVSEHLTFPQIEALSLLLLQKVPVGGMLAWYVSRINFMQNRRHSSLPVRRFDWCEHFAYAAGDAVSAGVKHPRGIRKSQWLALAGRLVDAIETPDRVEAAEALLVASGSEGSGLEATNKTRPRFPPKPAHRAEIYVGSFDVACATEQETPFGVMVSPPR